MRVIIIFLTIILINYINSTKEDEEKERKDAFVNDPVELKPVYHTPNKYEERSYDFWYENWPHPHVHGDKPLFDERHQHFPGYGDNYDFSNFITDPPTQNGAKSETVLEEASLVDEPVLDKSIKKSDSSSASDEDQKGEGDPKKSINQPKKDYENPSEPSISGEKLSKPISNLPAEGNDNEGDPYSGLSSVSSSSKYSSSSSSSGSGGYPEGPKSKGNYPDGPSSASSSSGGEYPEGPNASVSSRVYPQRPSPSSSSSSSVSHQSGYTDAEAAAAASKSASGTDFGSTSSGAGSNTLSSRSGSKSSGSASTSSSDYSDFDSVPSSSSSSSSVNTVTSGNPSNSRDVYSTSSSSADSAQGTSPTQGTSASSQGASYVEGPPSSSAQGISAGQGSSFAQGPSPPPQGTSSLNNWRSEGPLSPSTEDAYNTKPSLPSSSQSHSHSSASIPARGGEDEYFKSPPGVQPEVFPISKPNPEQQPYNNGGGGGTEYTQRPKPTPRVDEFFPEESETEQSRQTLSPRKPLSPSSSESESSGVNSSGGEDGGSSGPRSCCPCCRDPNLTPAISPGAAGCGAPSCGPPPIVGRPPNCCQQAPIPCCPTLPTCCLPQLPCCPRIQLTCCPPIRICCQPLNFGCSGGCRSRAVTRLRTKRNGCVPCLNGRKKREIQEEEEIHIRQKRLGCIPCLAREKRQTQSQGNCQKCNLFQQQIVRRVKRTFSCSSCATHRERVKRQSQIADFFRGNQLGNYGSNCQQCYDLPLPTRAMKKRSAGFSDGQHSFLARIKRASDGYDPLFQCDSGCCDYEKCIKSKPLKSESFKVPEDSDFISGTSSKDYDLPDLKEEEKSSSSSSSSSSSDSKKEELIGSKDALSLGGSGSGSSRGSDDRSFRS